MDELEVLNKELAEKFNRDPYSRDMLRAMIVLDNWGSIAKLVAPILIE